MIRFSCPNCLSVFSAPDDAAGRKSSCPKCGQRLQIPDPPANKSMLAPLVQTPTTTAAPVLDMASVVDWNATQPRPRKSHLPVVLAVVGVFLLGVLALGSIAIGAYVWFPRPPVLAESPPGGGKTEAEPPRQQDQERGDAESVPGPNPRPDRPNDSPPEKKPDEKKADESKPPEPPPGLSDEQQFRFRRAVKTLQDPAAKGSDVSEALRTLASTFEGRRYLIKTVESRPPFAHYYLLVIVEACAGTPDEVPDSLVVPLAYMLQFGGGQWQDSTRRQAVELLGAMGPRAKKALPTLALLRDNGPDAVNLNAPPAAFAAIKKIAVPPAVEKVMKQGTDEEAAFLKSQALKVAYDDKSSQEEYHLASAFLSKQPDASKLFLDLADHHTNKKPDRLRAFSALHSLIRAASEKNEPLPDASVPLLTKAIEADKDSARVLIVMLKNMAKGKGAAAESAAAALKQINK